MRLAGRVNGPEAAVRRALRTSRSLGTGLLRSEVVFTQEQQNEDQEDQKRHVGLVVLAVSVCHPRASFPVIEP